MLVYHTLKPIYNQNSRVLILGSMPSIKSREKNFYYAHKYNRFWPVLENIFNIKLDTTSQKINFLLNHNIALWDVFKSCEITASSDSSIRKGKLNNINLIIKESNIKAIFCTGKTAYNALVRNFQTNLPIFYLPSPSSANAGTKMETLVTEYSKITQFLC